MRESENKTDRDVGVRQGRSKCQMAGESCIVDLLDVLVVWLFQNRRLQRFRLGPLLASQVGVLTLTHTRMRLIGESRPTDRLLVLNRPWVPCFALPSGSSLLTDACVAILAGGLRGLQRRLRKSIPSLVVWRCPRFLALELRRRTQKDASPLAIWGVRVPFRVPD